MLHCRQPTSALRETVRDGCARPCLCRQRNRDPSIRLLKVNQLNLVEIMEVCSGSNRNLRWGIALVQFLIGVDFNILPLELSDQVDSLVTEVVGSHRYSHLLLKVDVDEMRLLTIRSASAQHLSQPRDMAERIAGLREKNISIIPEILKKVIHYYKIGCDVEPATREVEG